MRRLWLSCHRWMALSLGSILILSGLTGALLVVARPLDRLLHPDYFTAQGGSAAQPVSLESLRRGLAAEFGPQAAFTFRPPREPGETMQVLVKAQGGWRGTVYLDPASGREQGRRGDGEGLVAIVYKLHSALMLEQTGKAVLAWTALAYLVLLVSGLVLWWPRKWPPSLRMVVNKGALRAVFDIHRNGGAILALLLAVSIATGAYLAWRPIGGWITLASGQQQVVAPKLPPPPDGHERAVPTLDEMASHARAVFPGAAIGYVLYTPHSDRPMAIRMRVPDDPHPNGRSTVWFDPRDGRVLAAQRWSELDPGTRINSVMYPLHTGELGGVAGETVVALLGLGLGALGISGIWLWWRRKSLHGQKTKPVGSKRVL
ncbi:PepSY-associated TM helix domain-containing protein [Achromobacter arsenitoxydans]|uniref:PepSY-associated TM helix family protein 6 n=1 Tax=Achromobacter arsenitoxydans SY8 TaxID=477184 RepID=H0F838_9BURK|nr:PepSY-associated TM helix family protein 6 [Achromobacter arsenitoxydans SY8]